jgi:alpha-mannosidase
MKTGTAYKIYLIGNAHLDPVWLWKKPQGLAEVKATFLSVLMRMKEFPDFTFTCSSALYYKWVEENAPEIFEEIRQRVREGRWNIVGGWWIQPDCNLPCGESFVRHGLYSQRYFLDRFGFVAKTGYNVDSFGHSGMLPQILLKSGMQNYVFMRPSHDEKDLPGPLFWWESPDGSRVLTFRIPFCYNQEWGDPNDAAPTEKQKLIATRSLTSQLGYELMGFFGVGNHGGGPTISNLKMIEALKKEWGEDSLIMSSPDAYFGDMKLKKMDIPVVRDDLQHHASGVYCAHSAVKKLNRLSENRLMASEKLSTAAMLLTGAAFPNSRFERAWQQVLFNQFHDIITGCCIKEAYDDVFSAYGEALNIASEEMNFAVQKISWSIDTSCGEDIPLSKDADWILWEHENRGIPLVVFNILSWEIEAPIQVHRQVKTVTDDAGRALMIQHVRAPQMNLDDKWDTLFIGKIPAMGYRVFTIYRNLEIPTAAIPGTLNVSETHIENAFIRLDFDPVSGNIDRLYDKRTGSDILSGPGAAPVMIDEHDSDTWAHFIFRFDKVMGRFGDAEMKVLETGPLRAILRVTNRFERSVMQQDFILYHDRPDINVRVRLDWQERHKMLKIEFPLNITGSNATYEIPYGFIERPAEGLEETALQWADLSGTHCKSSIACGLTIITDAKYSFSASINTLSMSAVRSPIYADHYGYAERDAFCEFMDQGVQEFNYAIIPHEGAWQQSGATKKACELNTPPIQIMETYHKGPLGKMMQGINISAGNVIATVFKRAEDGGGYILRCYETEGTPVSATITLGICNREFAAVFGPCEIKTFFIPDTPEAPVSETSMIELEL